MIGLRDAQALLSNLAPLMTDEHELYNIGSLNPSLQEWRAAIEKGLKNFMDEFEELGVN